MAEKEKQIIQALADTLATMPEEKKQYLLGFAEGAAAMAAPKPKNEKEE